MNKQLVAGPGKFRRQLKLLAAAAVFLLLPRALSATIIIRTQEAAIVFPAPGDTIRPDSLSLQLPKDSAAITQQGFEEKNRRLIAAVLAFPVPFGITGLHRIYLGTSPWVPVVYFATLGGFGMLPLLDFLFIITSTDEELAEFANNGKVFMWVK